MSINIMQSNCLLVVSPGRRRRTTCVSISHSLAPSTMSRSWKTRSLWWVQHQTYWQEIQKGQSPISLSHHWLLGVRKLCVSVSSWLVFIRVESPARFTMSWHDSNCLVVINIIIISYHCTITVPGDQECNLTIRWVRLLSSGRCRY